MIFALLLRCWHLSVAGPTIHYCRMHFHPTPRSLTPPEWYCQIRGNLIPEQRVLGGNHYWGSLFRNGGWKVFFGYTSMLKFDWGGPTIHYSRMHFQPTPRNLTPPQWYCQVWGNLIPKRRVLGGHQWRGDSILGTTFTPPLSPWYFCHKKKTSK